MFIEGVTMASLALLAVKSSVVLLLGWVFSLLLRRSSAAIRHVIWTGVSAAVITLPLLMVSVPALRVPVWSVLPESGLVFRIVSKGEASRSGEQSARTANTYGFARAEERTQSSDPNRFLLLLWMGGTVLGMLRTGVAWGRVFRMRRNAIPIEDAEFDTMRGSLGIRQAVALLSGGKGTMPMATGVFRPAVLLPAEALTWTTERRRVVLLHELGHVARGDVATHVLARIALAMYWWNPLAWLAWREFLKERERAADDIVLQTGTAAPDYASHLLEIAKSMRTSDALAVAMARRSELEGRMIAILDSKMNRKSVRVVIAIGAIGLAVALAAPIAALQAQEKRAEEIVNDPKDGSGFLEQGRLLRRQGKRTESEASYRKALELLGEKPEAVEALTALGTMAFIQKDLVTAEDYLKRAQLLNPSKAGVALMWTAMVRQKQERIAEAESLFQAALAMQDKNSQESATTMELYGYLLDQAGRTDEARLLRERAMAIRKQTEIAVYAAAPKAEIFKIGALVDKPSLISKVEPQYTDEARAAKYQGTVVLSVEIHADGKAHNVRVVSGLGLGLNEQAMDAVSKWQFRPGMKDGQPVAVAATIEVNWRLL